MSKESRPSRKNQTRSDRCDPKCRVDKGFFDLLTRNDNIDHARSSVKELRLKMPYSADIRRRLKAEASAARKLKKQKQSANERLALAALKEALALQASERRRLKADARRRLKAKASGARKRKKQERSANE